MLCTLGVHLENVQDPGTETDKQEIPQKAVPHFPPSANRREGRNEANERLCENYIEPIDFSSNLAKQRIEESCSLSFWEMFLPEAQERFTEVEKATLRKAFFHLHDYDQWFLKLVYVDSVSPNEMCSLFGADKKWFEGSLKRILDQLRSLYHQERGRTQQLDAIDHSVPIKSKEIKQSGGEL